MITQKNTIKFYKNGLKQGVIFQNVNNDLTPSIDVFHIKNVKLYLNTQNLNNNQRLKKSNVLMLIQNQTLISI